MPGGVAVHDDGAEIGLGIEKGLTDTEHVLPRLVGEGDAGADAGVDEEVVAGRVREAEGAQELHVRGRNMRRPFRAWRVGVAAPASQGFAAAGDHPVGHRGALAGERVEHCLFVVADQVHGGHAGQWIAGGEAGDDAAAVGPAIDVVAEVDQQGGYGGAAREVVADGGMQLLQPIVAAMHVANGIDTLPGWQHPRRLHKLDHISRHFPSAPNSARIDATTAPDKCTMSKSRNILFICVDQWRGDSLGMRGHAAALTPNIDALAADAVLFRNHYGQAAPCGPARASLLTGQYVMNHRVTANGIPLDARHPNLATEVRRAGVEPYLIGYTTTTPDPRLTAPGDPRYAEIGDVMEGWQVFAHFDEVDYRNYFAWVAGRGVTLPENPFALWYPQTGPCGPTAAPCVVAAEHSDTAWTGEYGLQFLRGAGVARAGWPWLLHLNFLRPHPPFIACAPYHQAVPDGDIPAPIRAATRADEAAQHPILAHWLTAQKQSSYFEGASGQVADLSDADIALTRKSYYGLIAEIDVWIGRILAELRAIGQYDDTLIIFTSDHGEQLGDHRLLGKIGWFDQSYHLPLIMRAPGAAGGRVVEAFTEAVDLMPTILAWLGRAAPVSCDGVSLMPWIMGETPARWRTEVHFEYDLRGGWPEPSSLPENMPPEAGQMAVLRTAEWKYVHMPGLPSVLYDLVRDPDEIRNVAADPAYRGLLTEATQRMLTWRMLHEDPGHTNIVATPAGLTARMIPRAP